MKNLLREKFKAHEQVLGTFFNMGDQASLECLGYTGLDFVIIDTEHGPFDTESMSSLIHSAESVELAPVVRIADVTHKEIQRAADAGAVGIIAPCLRSVDEYKKLVDLAKYPPLGNRGFIKGRGCGFGYQGWAAGTLDTFMSASNEKLMVIPQCETTESLEHIEEIAALEGVDGIFVGPFDLSISMGIPGQFDTPVFKAAVKRIAQAFRAQNKPVYIFAGDAKGTRAYLDEGMDGVAISLNSLIMVEAYKRLVNEVRA